MRFVGHPAAWTTFGPQLAFRSGSVDIRTKRPSVIYLCNALDDATKTERKIATDSPAATNKVMGLCQALQIVGVEVCILSMGRGRQRGSWRWFAHVRRTMNRIQFCYASFWDVPVFTHLVTAISLARQLFRMGRPAKTVLIAYNRLWHYLPALLLARLRGMRCYLDLEDGYIGYPGIAQAFLKWSYDRLCNQGAMLACVALASQVKMKRLYVCYGTAVEADSKRSWLTGKLEVWFGGGLEAGKGGHLFIDGVRLLLQRHPNIGEQIHFTVTGKGELAPELRLFAEGEGNSCVTFRGDISREEFQRLLSRAHIGLSLNLHEKGLSDTVFPSKTVELASYGLLLMATSISDIPKMFTAEGALLLSYERPEELAEALWWAATHREALAGIAERGQAAVLDQCAPEQVGGEMAAFLKLL